MASSGRDRAGQPEALTRKVVGPVIARPDRMGLWLTDYGAVLLHGTQRTRSPGSWGQRFSLTLEAGCPNPADSAEAEQKCQMHQSSSFCEFDTGVEGP